MNANEYSIGKRAMGYELKNKYLHVQIADQEQLREARFDRTGFITQVTLLDPENPGKGQHTFCVSENGEDFAGRGGCGICNEFGINSPVGYEEAAAGQPFPKIGVGLLMKTADEPYHFHETYPFDPFELEVDKSADKVTFTVHPRLCRGYGIMLSKSLSIRRNRLCISYELTNTGSKRIDTEEYAHNFMGINSCSTGPEYILRLPEAPRFKEFESGYTAGLLQIQGNRVTWKQEPDRPFYGILQSGNPGACGGWTWELIHEPSRAGVREYDDFEPAYLALWGEKHVISPEVFLSIVLGPGESQRWTRTYEFFAW